MDIDITLSERQLGSRDTDTSTEVSSDGTLLDTNTLTGTVVVPSRDRSDTIITRAVWDQMPSTTAAGHSR